MMFAVFIFLNGIFSQGVASLIFLFLSNNLGQVNIMWITFLHYLGI